MKMQMTQKNTEEVNMNTLDISFPQVFALQTQGKNTEAARFIRTANRKILPHHEDGSVDRNKMKMKYFTFFRRGGKSYRQRCPYVALTPRALRMVLQNEWVVPLDDQVPVVQSIIDHAEECRSYVIRKRDLTSGRHFSMLYVEGPDDS